MPARSLRAQEAELASTLSREIMEALGTDAAEFGGEEAAEQTANRLMVEATESAGKAGGQIAKEQVGRIVASRNEALIFDLKSISGKSLPLLEDVGDDALPATVSTLARPGVDEGIQSLGSPALRRAALEGETRLPGAGLKLVEHYGDEGAQLATKLNEDQANSIIAALRPNAVNSLPPADRSALLNALVSRPGARVFNFVGVTGPLVVVASGIVIWHAIDLTLSPDERVTERPDGTVVRETTGLGSRAVGVLPAVVRQLSTPLSRTGVALAAGASVVAVFVFWRREKRRGFVRPVRREMD